MNYGCITGVHRSKMYPVAASQYFARSGGAFVYLDANGRVTLALTATATIFGYAVAGAGAGAGTDANVWLSSATAGADKVPVIRITNELEFLVPSDGTPTIAMAGNACDLIAVNDGTIQTADIGTSTTDVLLIQDIGTKAGGSVTDVIVKVNPAKIQADT